MNFACMYACIYAYCFCEISQFGVRSGVYRPIPANRIRHSLLTRSYVCAGFSTKAICDAIDDMGFEARLIGPTDTQSKVLCVLCIVYKDQSYLDDA